jgi:23S rRNA pseudouridine955/2504/2580 synthase
MNNTDSDSTTKASESEHVYSKVVFETVSEHDSGQRLDNFLLKRFKDIPKSKIYQIIRKGEVRVDKKRAKAATKLEPGQVVRVPPLKTQVKDQQLIEGQLKLAKSRAQMADILDAVLYEDDYLLVINKPAGLAVHGGSGVSLGLIELLRAAKPESDFLELVHRLDRETSGCIVIAKKGSSLRELHQLIRDSNLSKYYLALLDGRWKGSVHEVDASLQKNTLQSGERMVRVSRDGKASKTIFRVQKHYADCTLVEAELLTGRTHQIRVHSQYAGHSILGDPKYGSDKANAAAKIKGLNRMFLHAHRLVLPLSFYAKPMTIIAPLDEHLSSYLDSLYQGTSE